MRTSRWLHWITFAGWATTIIIGCSKVYGWEEKETKISGGGTSVGHEKLAEARIRAMTAADLNRFMVTCAIVPDLYCPGYSLAETLSKEANLMRTAACYKVAASKITATVTAELSSKRRAGKGQHCNSKGA